MGSYFMEQLRSIYGVVDVRGKGLMIGVDFDFPVAQLRKVLLHEYHILSGSAKSPNTLRFLPPLNISKAQIDHAVHSLSQAVTQKLKSHA